MAPATRVVEVRIVSTWMDVVASLAGPRATLRERPSPADWGGNVVAEVELPRTLRVFPTAAFQAAGDNGDDAWRPIAHDLARYRLVEALEAAVWHEVEEVVDETTYVAAMDPSGIWWAFGVAAADNDLRLNIETDMGFDSRPIGRVVFIEPTDALDADTLFAALQANA